MYEVLLAVGSNESRAVAQAEAVAALPEAAASVHATVLHAFVDNPEGASVGQVGAARRAREVLEAAGVDVTLAESSGDPAEAILQAAEARDVDCLCLGSRKRSPAGKALFGSVAQAVFRGTERPVLLCGPGNGSGNGSG